MTITPLPQNIRLLYKRIPRYTNTSYFREFTYEEVRNMNLDELDYSYAVDEFAHRLMDFEEDSPRTSEAEPQTSKAIPPLRLPQYYAENWEGLLNKWREGSQIWLMTSANGSGYMIDYSFNPGRVYEWIDGNPMFIIELPGGYELIIKRIPDFGREEYFA
ncbi:MAG: hypothetical protein ACKPKO_61195, partial [Candidatus Fonsibacter sp.]